MSPVSVVQSGFTAGELSPALMARLDLDTKYGKGCVSMRNFLVRAQGPATKRPGFALLDALPGIAVLREFVFNDEQAYALAFGDFWMRVATRDGVILDASGNVLRVASPYSYAQAKELSFAQSADVLFIACQGVRPQRLMRFAHDDWQFEPMFFTAPISPPEWESRDVDTTSYSLAYASGSAYSYTDPVYDPDTGAVITPGKYVAIGRDLYSETIATDSEPNIEFVNQAKCPMETCRPRNS